MPRNNPRGINDKGANTAKKILPDSWMAIEDIVKGNVDCTPELKFRAATFVIERVQGKAKQTIKMEGEVNHLHMHLDAVRALTAQAKGEFLDLNAEKVKEPAVLPAPEEQSQDDYEAEPAPNAEPVIEQDHDPLRPPGAMPLPQMPEILKRTG